MANLRDYSASPEYWTQRIKRAQNTALAQPKRAIHVRAGLYYIYTAGALYELEHVSEHFGFSQNGWIVRKHPFERGRIAFNPTVTTPAYPTRRDALAAILAGEVRND